MPGNKQTQPRLAAPCTIDLSSTAPAPFLLPFLFFFSSSFSSSPPPPPGILEQDKEGGLGGLGIKLAWRTGKQASSQAGKAAVCLAASMALRPESQKEGGCGPHPPPPQVLSGTPVAHGKFIWIQLKASAVVR